MIQPYSIKICILFSSFSDIKWCFLTKFELLEIEPIECISNDIFLRTQCIISFQGVPINVVISFWSDREGQMRFLLGDTMHNIISDSVWEHLCSSSFCQQLYCEARNSFVEKCSGGRRSQVYQSKWTKWLLLARYWLLWLLHNQLHNPRICTEEIKPEKSHRGLFNVGQQRGNEGWWDKKIRIATNSLLWLFQISGKEEIFMFIFNLIMLFRENFSQNWWMAYASCCTMTVTPFSFFLFLSQVCGF